MRPELSFMKMMGMMSESKCVWVSEFDEDSAARFYDKFLELEKDPEVQIIPIFINSYGGQVYALTAMRDLIKSSPKPVATIAVGMAMSCGASLLACGTKGLRFASPDADILIHQVSGGTWGKTADIEESARQYKRMNQKMLENLAKDTGKPKDYFQKRINKMANVDWTVDAEEAKRLGLIDHVSIPRLTNHQQASMLADVPSYDEQVKMQEELKPSKRRGKPRSLKPRGRS